MPSAYIIIKCFPRPPLQPCCIYWEQTQPAWPGVSSYVGAGQSKGRSWPWKTPALKEQEHWTPPLQTFEMQQVEDGGGGPQQQGPAFFYRDVIAISRLVASRPAWVLIPSPTKLEGKLEGKRPKEVQNSTLSTLQEASLLRAQQRRCQRHAGYFLGGTPHRAKGWKDGGVGELLGLQKRLSQFGDCLLSHSALGNEGLAAGLAAESPQVSWCVSLSASQKAELHVNSWQCHKNSPKSLKLKHPAWWATVCFTGFFKGSSATRPHLERHSSVQVPF